MQCAHTEMFMYHELILEINELSLAICLKEINTFCLLCLGIFHYSSPIIGNVCCI